MKKETTTEEESINSSSVYMRCKQCNNPVAVAVDILSKSFVGRHGKAYMLSSAMNVVIGAKHNKQLITGYYTIAPIFCSTCGEELGWTYLRAFNHNHSFKEGRYILELANINYDDDDDVQPNQPQPQPQPQPHM